MKTPAALALLLFLTACAAPGPYATPAPGEAAFLASGTMTAVATYDYATRVEYTRQAVAFSDATAQAVYTTRPPLRHASCRYRHGTDAGSATAAAATVTAQAAGHAEPPSPCRRRRVGSHTPHSAQNRRRRRPCRPGRIGKPALARRSVGLAGLPPPPATSSFIHLLCSLAAGRLAKTHHPKCRRRAGGAVVGRGVWGDRARADSGPARQGNGEPS